MKSTPLLFTVLLSLASGPVQAAPATPAPRTDVAFIEPEKFTDLRDSWAFSDVRRTTHLDTLREHLVERTRTYVPEGQRLSITVTDIDLAGDFEPWRGPRFDDVRIIKDLYPPRINLSFRLTDASGRVMKEGSRQLRDLAFLMRITSAFPSDPLRHEKELLNDWLRDEFGR